MEEPEDQPRALPEVINSDSQLHIDDEAPCYAENDSIEDEIVEALRSKTPQQQDDHEADDDQDDDQDDETSVSRVTHVAVRHCTASAMLLH